MNLRIKLIFLVSIFIFTVKWIFIFYYNSEFNLLTNFIYDAEDHQYFPLIYNLANLNFSPTYDASILDAKYLPIPIYSLIFHSIFFKIFNVYGFIVIEFLSILIFFYIFSLLVTKFGLSDITSVFLALSIFLATNLIDFFHLYNFPIINEIPYLNSIKEFYNVRIPRPMISNLYLFFFLTILIFIEKKEDLTNKNLILIGAFLAFMWSSFYYNFVISAVTFLLYYLTISVGFQNKFTKYFTNFFIIFLSFCFFSIPTFFLLFKSEPDYLTRVGLLALDFNQKKILLMHYLTNILSIKFLIFFFLNTFFFVFLKFRNYYRSNKINLLYLLFLSSFLAPFIFIIISPSISESYHFSNTMISIILFVTAVFFLLFIKIIFNNTYFSNNKIPMLLIIFLLGFFFVESFLISKKNSLSKEKFYHDDVVNFIKENKIIKEVDILTFDGEIQTSLILNGYKNFDFILGIYTPLSDYIIEEKLYDIFRFLDLSPDYFNEFIKNKKTDWRYINNNIGKTFYMKYQANSLSTFKNTQDFLTEELNSINNSSPTTSQQLIIPQFELSRLNEEFISLEIAEKVNSKLIIINTKDLIFQNVRMDNEFFCEVLINERYRIFLHKSLNKSCLFKSS